VSILFVFKCIFCLVPGSVVTLNNVIKHALQQGEIMKTERWMNLEL